MKILFMEIKDKPEKTIDAHVRNCIELRKELIKKGFFCDISYSDTHLNYMHNEYDVVIVSYASYYANVKDMLKVINNNKKAKLFWLTNEYNLTPNGSLGKIFRERNAEIIANYEKSSKSLKCFRKFNFLNINLLFYDEKPKQDKKYSFVYYGTFRKDRAKYFKKYFDENIIVSTSKKNIKKFRTLDVSCKFANKFTWGKEDTLGLFRYSLYIEDIHIHTNFNNLANRFYESLSNDAVVLFDKNCINTLKKSELTDYQDFLIESTDLKNRNYEEDLKKQTKWKKLVAAARVVMLENFVEIIKGGNNNEK